MKDVAKAAYTLLCALLFMVFMFATVTSIAVALGLLGDSDRSWIGIITAVVFWFAAGKYRKLFKERVEDVQKSIKPPDDQSDDPF